MNSEPIHTFGSLFAGIGGFDLGFERAGMSCRWQVEIDDYANRVLEKHWPDVHRERDIRSSGWHNLQPVDIIIGGFPCQDISYAGRGAGLDGERSGLFFEAIRVVRELQPRVVVLENVAALLTRGLDRVLGTLAEIGFDAEWHCIPAASVGAPHIRDRVFILAYADPNRSGERCQRAQDEGREATEDRGTVLSARRKPAGSDAESTGAVPDSNSGRQQVSEERDGESIQRSEEAKQRNNADGLRDDVADTSRQQSGLTRETIRGCVFGGRLQTANNTSREDKKKRRDIRRDVGYSSGSDGEWWATEPDVGRVANGVPARVDRLRGLGNAVVPQVAEFVGRMVREKLNEQ